MSEIQDDLNSPDHFLLGHLQCTYSLYLFVQAEVLLRFYSIDCSLRSYIEGDAYHRPHIVVTIYCGWIL